MTETPAETSAEMFARATEALETLEHPENYATAEPLFRAVVAMDQAARFENSHVEHAASFVSCLVDLGKADEARAVMQQIFGRIDRDDAGQTPLLVETLYWLGYVEQYDGNLARAERLLQGALTSWRDTGKAFDVTKFTTERLLDEVRARLGRTAET